MASPVKTSQQQNESPLEVSLTPPVVALVNAEVGAEDGGKKKALSANARQQRHRKKKADAATEKLHDKADKHKQKVIKHELNIPKISSNLTNNWL